jgi:hypothetical protein
VAVYARDEFLYEVSKVQFPWEDASKRTVLVAHRQLETWRPVAGEAVVQESFVAIPDGYVSTRQESWAGLDEQGRYTQYLVRWSEPWLGRSSESHLTKDGEFVKTVRTFPGDREERSTYPNEMAADPGLVRDWPEVWLAEPGWEEEGTALLGEVPVRSVVRTIDVQQEFPPAVVTVHERLILDASTGRVLRHDRLNDDGSLQQATDFVVIEVFIDPRDVPPGVWETSALTS